MTIENQVRVQPIRATETQLIPFAELSTGQASAIRNGSVAAVVALATKILREPANKLIVRDIRPKEDLDFTRATWLETTGATVDVYEDMTAGTLADRRFIGIYGIEDDTDAYNVSKLRIKIGNSIKSIWMLENLYSYNAGPRIGFTSSTIIIPMNTPYDREVCY